MRTDAGFEKRGENRRKYKGLRGKTRNAGEGPKGKGQKKEEERVIK